jgi:CDP-glycerol glycerophosphotransferase (TagB/SpsB family)
VLYKPHPRVGIAEDAGVAKAHQQILKLMDRAAAADPARGHAVLMDADVLGVIRCTDVMVADVSSVSLDHLYLRPDSPLVLTDRRTDRVRLLEDAPVASGSYIVDESTIGRLAQDLASILSDDHLHARRYELRDFYFDGLAPGQSTRRFWDELKNAIHHHDAALRELSRVRVIEENA